MSILDVADYGKLNFGKRNHFESYQDVRLHEFNKQLKEHTQIEGIEFNHDEMERLNMLMSGPYNDCVCKHPVPIKTYIDKFYYGDML